MLNGWNFQVVDLGIAADDPVELEGIFRQGAKEADVILSTGGVSVGEEDHVKAVLEQMGSLELWKIAMKPGKPLAFGHIGDTAFMGLPGNPASALVTALIVARPFLFQCQGRTDGKVMPTAVQAGFDKPAVTRQEYLRVRLGAGVLERHKNQSSGVLLSASWGDGLAIQMPGQDIVAGEAMDYLPFSSML